MFFFFTHGVNMFPMNECYIERGSEIFILERTSKSEQKAEEGEGSSLDEIPRRHRPPLPSSAFCDALDRLSLRLLFFVLSATSACLTRNWAKMRKRKQQRRFPFPEGKKESTVHNVQRWSEGLPIGCVIPRPGFLCRIHAT